MGTIQKNAVDLQLDTELMTDSKNYVLQSKLVKTESFDNGNKHCTFQLTFSDLGKVLKRAEIVVVTDGTTAIFCDL